jgi:biopolymer transport protein ExbD
MKFRRQHQLACSLPGAVPIACVMFLFLFYLITNSALLLVEGVPVVRLPEGEGTRPVGYTDSVVVAMDEQHRLYFRNRRIDLDQLQSELKRLAERVDDPGLLLVLKADRAANNQAIMRVAAAAQNAGVSETWLATRPRLFERTPRGQ